MPAGGHRELESAQAARPKRHRSRNETVRLRRKGRRVTSLLQSVYGSPRHDNKDDPLDELVFIILSQMTTHKALVRVYNQVKAAYPSWGSLLEMPLDEVRALIHNAGLSYHKAPRIKAILRKIAEDFGEVSLEALRDMPDAEAEEYLRSLPGVGTKTARCVMMFSLGRQVLPVDTHVLRVAKRLGLMSEDLPEGQVHSDLDDLVAPEERYRFHVNAVAHGRTTCLAVRPHCDRCVLQEMCLYPAKEGKDGQYHQA